METITNHFLRGNYFQIRYVIKQKKSNIRGFGLLKENPFSHTVFAFFVDVITPISTQIRTMSQLKLKVLTDLNKDKCVTLFSPLYLMHISAFSGCSGFGEFIIESWKKKSRPVCCPLLK